MKTYLHIAFHNHITHWFNFHTTNTCILNAHINIHTHSHTRYLMLLSYEGVFIWNPRAMLFNINEVTSDRRICEWTAGLPDHPNEKKNKNCPFVWQFIQRIGHQRHPHNIKYKGKKASESESHEKCAGHISPQKSKEINKIYFAWKTKKKNKAYLKDL